MVYDDLKFKGFSKKRGCNTIRKRCLQFIEVLKQNGYINQTPLEEAKALFMKTMGIMDRTSLKAYFGSQAHRSIRKIQKIARYSTGTMSYKTIELAQEVPHKRGYFEVLGLAKFELRGKTWFMILTNEVLVPELFPQYYESSEVSMENLSLSPILQGKECEKTVLEVVSPNDMETEKSNKQTTTYRMRERNEKSLLFPQHVYTNQEKFKLTPLELAVLNAKPVDSEPDRAKIQWRSGSE